MNKKIVKSDKEINYTIKVSKRAKRMRIAVNCDGSVVVTKPRFFSNVLLEKFLHEKFYWILSKVEYFSKHQENQISMAGYCFDHRSRVNCLELVETRLMHFNQYYNFTYKKISIRNQKSRWGSCSAKRNMNFNYRLIHLPSELADYIIVHELCHLKELNHSKKFWDLVGKTTPNYKMFRKKLRDYKFY